MPVRAHVPLYFANMVLIIMQPLQCDAVCQRFADLAAGLQIIDKIDERTARVNRENQFGGFVALVPTVPIPAAR